METIIIKVPFSVSIWNLFDSFRQLRIAFSVVGYGWDLIHENVKTSISSSHQKYNNHNISIL